ncbi:MAG: FAD-dependent oxidoreductase [Oscillospiraceae bacterium]|nr:FAD-dependent oxidoreductase [Oscillospiraceae bacterium]
MPENNTLMLHCDVAVIGAGVAGCAAAQAAASAGAEVIVIEKLSGITAHGLDVAAIGSRLQREAGIEIDPLEAARLIYAWGQSRANYDLIRVFTDRSGAAMDGYLDLAEKYGLETRLNDDMTARADWDDLEPRFRQFRTAHNFFPKGGSAPTSDKTVARHFVGMLRDDAVAHGAQFMFGCRAAKIIKHGGSACGVLVACPSGPVEIAARMGIILAAGGITENERMLLKWCPEALRADKNEYFPRGGNSGDSIILGRMAGAAVSRSGAAAVIHPVNFTPLGPGIQTSWLMVSKLGRRFCCEMSWEPIITNARLNAPGNEAWAVWDSRYREHVLRQEPRRAALLVGIEEKMESAVASGDYLRSDTLEGLAALMGVPADELLGTVERYNGWCRSGEDRDFGVPARFLSSVEEGPFYASKVTAWLLNVCLGLHVDRDSRVLTPADKPIPKLFAIGNSQGDFFANSYPVTCPGANNGRSAVFGTLVGAALAKGKTISGSLA